MSISDKLLMQLVSGNKAFIFKKDAASPTFSLWLIFVPECNICMQNVGTVAGISQQFAHAVKM